MTGRGQGQGRRRGRPRKLPAQDLPAQDLPAQDLPAQDLPAQAQAGQAQAGQAQAGQAQAGQAREQGDAIAPEVNAPLGGDAIAPEHNAPLGGDAIAPEVNAPLGGDAIAPEVNAPLGGDAIAPEHNAALGGDAQPVNRCRTVILRTVIWITVLLFVAGLGHFLEWYTGWHLLTNYSNTGVWTQVLQEQILWTIFGTLLAIMFTQRPRTLFICMLCIFALLRLGERWGVMERPVRSSKRDRF